MSEIRLKTENVSTKKRRKKMHLKMSPAKCHLLWPHFIKGWWNPRQWDLHILKRQLGLFHGHSILSNFNHLLNYCGKSFCCMFTPEVNTLVPWHKTNNCWWMEISESGLWFSSSFVLVFINLHWFSWKALTPVKWLKYCNDDADFCVCIFSWEEINGLIWNSGQAECCYGNSYI